MEHPKDVGDRTTLAIMLALTSAGYAISVPFGENTRYDLVIDDGAGLSRVQCKTGRLRAGAIRFATCSSYGHHARPSHGRQDYLGQIEYFAVHCPETSGVYLIPINDVQTLPAPCCWSSRAATASDAASERLQRMTLAASP